MDDGKCPCDQHTNKVPLPEDESKICVYWDIENDRCNLTYMRNKEARDERK